MDEETQKIIEEQMGRLPADVKAAIVSVDYKKKLEEVVKRQRLMIDQAGKMEMETTLVMIGLEPLSDYIANLERELEVNDMRAKDIAMDVNEHIFKPIRESLQKMEDELGNETEGEEEELGNISSKLVIGGQEEGKELFTNTNEEILNRDQILNEIENPIPNHIAEEKVEETNKIEIRPIQELATVAGEEVEDKTKSIFESKMSETTISNSQNIEVKPEIKLPEITKKEIATDPYKEPLI